MTVRTKELDGRNEHEHRPAQARPHDARQQAPGQLLALQRTAGNAAVTAMLARRDEESAGGGGTFAALGAMIGVGAELLFGPSEVEIGESVGRGGKNVPDDVAQVRSRLTGLGYDSANDVDSLGGAIERYQDEVVGLNRPDGRVDPGGRTVKALSARKSKAAAAPAPAPPGGSIWGDPAAPAAAPTGEPKPPGPGSAAPAAPVPAADDAEVARILASVKNPAVDEVAGDVARLSQKAKLVPKHMTEEKGTERDKLVEDIAKVRPKIAALGPGLDPKMAAQLKAHFFHAVNAASPSYTQENIDILEMAGQFRTCNVTSLAMTLEALGKSTSDYKPQEAVAAVAKVYAHRVAEARDDPAKTVEGLRLPDFLQLAAVAEVLGAKVADPAAIKKAGQSAWDKILDLKFIGRMAPRFGASVQHRFFKFNATLAAEQAAPAAKKGKKKRQLDHAAETWSLREHGRRHRTAGDAHADKANQLADVEEQLETETNPKKRKALEAKKHKLEGAVANTAGLADAKSETELPLEQYKDSVLDQISPAVDAGSQVILGMWNHFARLESLGEDFIVIDDPAQWGRANRKVTWEEARAMGYFWQWLVVS